MEATEKEEDSFRTAFNDLARRGLQARPARCRPSPASTGVSMYLALLLSPPPSPSPPAPGLAAASPPAADCQRTPHLVLPAAQVLSDDPDHYFLGVERTSNSPRQSPPPLCLTGPA